MQDILRLFNVFKLIHKFLDKDQNQLFITSK